MENKKNTLVIVLIVIIAILCVTVGWLVAGKFNDSTNGDKNANQTMEENNANSNTTDVKTAIDKFIERKNLSTNSVAYDMDALSKMNCTDALSALGNGYSLEIYTFKDSDSAKRMYAEQYNYQLQVNNVKQVVGSGNKENYNYYEAILIPNLEMSPAATGDEHSYLYHLRIDNYYISFYEVSTNTDKNSMMRITNELKHVLGVK